MKYRIHILSMIVLASLGVRLWLVNERWVNPDEGAHLMDAVLTNQGHIPLVDFISRQPAYTCAIAGVFKLTGASLWHGRLMNVALSLLCGAVIFLIAKHLFDQRTAVVSAAVYWLLPLEVLNSTVVKTQPLTNLLACLSVFACLIFMAHKRWGWLIASGALASLAFYVRQSAILVPATILLILLLLPNATFKGNVRRVIVFGIGYLMVAVMIMGIYSGFMPIEKIIASDLNPLSFLLDSFSKTPYLINTKDNTLSIHLLGSAQRAEMIGMNFVYLKQAISMHLFLIVSAVSSVVLFLDGEIVKRERTTGFPPLFIWALTLFAGYGYYFCTKGFFIDYAREFFPPLIILFAAFTCRVFSYRKIVIRYALMFMLIGSFAYSMVYSWQILSISYDSVWSPAAVNDVAKFLKGNTAESDEIISGAVVWELQAGRSPYRKITHPLSFEFPIAEDKRKILQAALVSDPSRVIILDGFTEKTYFRQVPHLQELIDSTYSLVHSSEQAGYPVRVYMLTSE